MVGTRNIAFPRLNAFSYWMFLFGGCFLWISFALNVGPDVGWFAYVPLSSLQYTPTKRPDVWAQMITFTEVAALAVSVEIVVTRNQPYGGGVCGVQLVADAAPACRCDFNHENGVDLLDIFAFLEAWFAGNPAADFNGRNGVDLLDIFSFLECWFSAPAGC